MKKDNCGKNVYENEIKTSTILGVHELANISLGKLEEVSYDFAF